MKLNQRIFEQINEPIAKHDVNWLRESLQIAAQIELFTLPPYLYALWSIKKPNDFAAIAIRSILIEEMLHLGLVCNMLKAIGTTPDLTSIDRFPQFPDNLPGNVNPELIVNLSPFSKKTLNVFMEIEKPDFDPVATKELFFENQDDEYASIGELYNSIENAFKNIKPEFELTGQITGPKAPFAISSLEQIEKAIQIIKDQGEGSSSSPIDSTEGDLAHYYKFAELYFERKLIQNEQKEWKYEGDRIKMPEIENVHDVPLNGFERKGLSIDTITKLDQFNIIYTEVIDEIESAWRNGQYPLFMQALEKMFSLESLGRSLMKINVSINDVEKGLGPEFKRNTGYNNV